MAESKLILLNESRTESNNESEEKKSCGPKDQVFTMVNTEYSPGKIISSFFNGADAVSATQVNKDFKKMITPHMRAIIDKDSDRIISERISSKFCKLMRLAKLRGEALPDVLDLLSSDKRQEFRDLYDSLINQYQLLTKEQCQQLNQEFTKNLDDLKKTHDSQDKKTTPGKFAGALCGATLGVWITATVMLMQTKNNPELPMLGYLGPIPIHLLYWFGRKLSEEGVQRCDLEVIRANIRLFENALNALRPHVSDTDIKLNINLKGS